MSKRDQPGLFDTADAAAAVNAPAHAALPQGFKYEADVISPDEESALVRQVETLPFKELEFHGFTGKRRVVSFGWRYDFTERELQRADDIPPILMPLRERVAAFAGTRAEDFQHVLVTEYSPGAAIGWHRDKAQFAEVIGVSLLAPCRFRLRRRHAGKWERAAVTLEPRSAYLLAGPSRADWEHSIPPVDRLRYSITFRNFIVRA